jgi:hypothetical protein
MFPYAEPQREDRTKMQHKPIAFGQAFWGSEHPDTARLRVQQDYVDKMIALKRENMDRVSSYIDDLMAKAKEELGHARSGSNELRKIAMAQHIEEIVAYLRGQGIEIQPPAAEGTGARRSFALDEVPAFFGRVRCVLDQWHGSHMIELYDEMVTLVKLKKQVPAAE